MKLNRWLWVATLATITGFSGLALALSPAFAHGGGDQDDRGRNRGPGRGDERRPDPREDRRIEIRMRASLSGGQEVPANSSTASGRGEFTVDAASNTLSFNISFSGLTGMETSAHIHGPAAVMSTVGVLFTLPLGTPKIGVWHYDEALEADILGGRTYVNVHSATFPGGEIRGQILPR